MIEAQVLRNEEIIMTKQYADTRLTLEDVLKQLELYVVAEQLNNSGECLIRVRFK